MLFSTKSINNNRGATIVEVILVIAVVVIFSTFMLINLNPEEKRKIARDNKRISDLSLLDRMIIEFQIDNQQYPDDEDTLRNSITLPMGATALDNSTAGWINENLSKYNAKLPLDPLNTPESRYFYYHDGNSYEVNATLETLFEEAQNDGGDDSTRYELGNNLFLISP